MRHFLQKQTKPLLVLLGLLGCLLCKSEAATVRFAWTNYLGQPDTNWFIVYPVGDVADATGSFITKGPPTRLTPNASGLVTNTFELGTYVASNRFLGRGIAFRVPNDHGPTVYCATCGTNNTPAGTGLAISGFNHYITIVYGTNPPPTYDEITNTLGFLPLTAPQTTNAISQATNGAIRAVAAGSNITLATNGQVVTISSSASGGGGTPGGSDKSIQFNSSGIGFGGENAFSYNSATDTLTTSNGVFSGTTTLNQIEAVDGTAVQVNDHLKVDILKPGLGDNAVDTYGFRLISKPTASPQRIWLQSEALAASDPARLTFNAIAYNDSETIGYYDPTNGFVGKFVGIFTGNGAGITNVDHDMSRIYVAPWGSPTAWRRGDSNAPIDKLWDWNGTTRSGATAHARAGDTIFVLGTNYASVVPLHNGVTLDGLRHSSAILYTNGNTFTNDWRAARGGWTMPNFPYIATDGYARVQNLYINARDGTWTNGQTTDPSYISVFNANGFGNSETWVLDNPTFTNTITMYTPYSSFGFTNRITLLEVFNCDLLGNVDVFYINGQKTIKIYNSSTNDAGYDELDYTGQSWGVIENAMTWTTNTLTAPDFHVRTFNVRRDSFWDYDFYIGENVFVTHVGGEGYCRGYGGGSGYGSGIKLSGGVQYADFGGKHYLANATNLANNFAVQITGNTLANFDGTEFYRSNTAGVFVTGSGAVRGTVMDVFTGTTYVLGATNIIGGFRGSSQQTNGPWSITRTGGFTGLHTGDGSGLTNLSGSGWALSGNSGLSAANVLGTLDNVNLKLVASNSVLANFSGYSNTIVMGNLNYISGWQPYSVIGGGRSNLITAPTNSAFHYLLGYNTISGGASNSITGTSVMGGNTIGGGIFNSILDDGANPSTIAGGQNGKIFGPNGVIGGGEDNDIGSSASVFASYGTIGGGYNNTIVGSGSPATNDYATVSGGRDNTSSGGYAVIPGGNQNTASGSNSIAMGFKASATHAGSVVISADVSATTGQASPANNSFTVNASGGINLLGSAITGDGSGLTNISASALASGTVAPARLATNSAFSNSWLRATSASTSEWSRDGSGLTNLPPPAPLEPQTRIYLKDEFASGNIGSGDIGELGWVFDAIGSGGGVSQLSATYGHPQMGVVRVYSTVNAAGETLSIGNSGYVNSATNRSWRVTFVGNTDQTTSVRLYFGLGDGTTALQANGIGFRYDTTLSDTAWMAYVMSGGTQSATTTGVAVNTTAFPRFQIECNSAGTITYFINGTQVATRTTGGPATTVFLRPQAQILSDGAVTRHWHFDYFAFTEDSTR